MSYEGDRRPSSDTLVDLHVSIVPVEHWVERLNYASCKVISDTFSAGFITVSPDTHVARLRNEIQDQLGQTNFPTEYVFLKHVGRCLALVRQNQETKLKVKSFLPPHSVVPEIFILPGHPNMYKYSVLPPINAMHQDLHSDENNDSDAPEKVVLPNIKRRKQLNSLSLNENSLDNEVPHQISNTKKPQRQHKNPSLESQKRHLSGKSSYNSSPLTPKTRKSSNSLYDDNPSLSPETVNTTPKLRNYPSTIGKQPQPTKAKSVLKEGPKQQHVDYKRPLESNSAVSSIENHKNGEGFPSSPFQTDNKRYMYSTNDDSGYVDIEQSGSEASTPFVQPPRRNSLPFPKNMDSNPNPEGLDEDSDKRYSPGSKRRSKVWRAFSPKRSNSFNYSKSVTPTELTLEMEHTEDYGPANLKHADRKIDYTNVQMKFQPQVRGRNPFPDSSETTTPFGPASDDLSDTESDGHSSPGLTSSAQLDYESGEESNHSERRGSIYHASFRQNKTKKYSKVYAGPATSEPPDSTPATEGLYEDNRLKNSTNFSTANDNDSFNEIPLNTNRKVHRKSLDNDEPPLPTNGLPDPVKRLQATTPTLETNHNHQPHNTDGDHSSRGSADVCINSEVIGDRFVRKSLKFQATKSTAYSPTPLKPTSAPPTPSSAKTETFSPTPIHQTGGKTEDNFSGATLKRPAWNPEDDDLISGNLHRGDPDGMPTVTAVSSSNDRTYPTSPPLEVIGHVELVGGLNGGLESMQSLKPLKPLKPLDLLEQTAFTQQHTQEISFVKPDHNIAKSEALSENGEMGDSGDGGDLEISSKNDDTKTTRPLKKPLSIEPPEEVEKHTPSPITIPMFKKPPVERRDLIDSSQSSIRNSGAPGQKSVEGQSKIKAETVEKNTKGSEKGVKQKANAMKHTENGPKQINKLQKNSEKRPDSSSREKLWAELQKARGERKVAENKRQELVKQAKMTTSKMNQKRTSVSAEYKKLYPRLKSGKQKTDSSPKEKCDVPGCYYVFQTSADKKRHFGLVHRSRITRVRDIWKKKFFEEKKKTMPLNDVLNRLQQEFNKLHHRLVSVLDDQKTLGRQKVQVLPVTKVLPSIKNNTRIQVTRYQHEIDNLRQKIEDAKIKLTGEMKLRHHADEDVKVVRQDLLSKKIQAHVAFRNISSKPPTRVK